MRIAILATRIAGNDGVSLEIEHWRNILEGLGHQITLVAGELDREGVLIPELHFRSAKVSKIHDDVVYGDASFKSIIKDIDRIAAEIEKKLEKHFFNSKNKADLLIVPNVFSLPMHFPLAVALTNIIRKKNIPCIGRHHDFWWERRRYLNSEMFGFFEKYFPPKIPTLFHTVINSVSQYDLKKREGIEAPVIHDSFDFNSNLDKNDEYSSCWRKDFGIDKNDIVFLQATRVVPRKRIEMSIEIVEKLKNKKAVLVIAGKEGDEVGDYINDLRKKADNSSARVLFIGDRINSKRKIIGAKKIYTLWDCYNNSNFAVYPTRVEGFGNQFIEAMYFRLPIILTPYHVYKSDIAPLGFKSLVIPGKINDKVITGIKELIKNRNKKDRLTEHNYQLAKENFSYEATEKKIKKLLTKMKMG